jgi:hypothetical protein
MSSPAMPNIKRLHSRDNRSRKILSIPNDSDAITASKPAAWHDQGRKSGFTRDWSRVNAENRVHSV